MANKKSDPTPASKKEAPKQTPAPMPKQEARQEAKQEARQEAKQAVQSGTFGKDDIKALRIADVKPSVIQNLKEAAKVAAPAPTPAKVAAPAPTPAKVTAPAPTPVRATAPTPAPMPKQEAKQEAKQAVQSGTFGKDDVQALRAADVKPSVIQNLREAAKESVPARVAAPTPMPKQEAKQEARQAVQSGSFGKDDVQALRAADVKPSVIQNLREAAREQTPDRVTTPTPTPMPRQETRQETPRQETPRQETPRQETPRQETRQETPRQEAKQDARQAVESGTFGKDDVKALRDAGVKSSFIQDLRETVKETAPVTAETVAPTETRTIKDASRLGEAIRIAGEGGLTKGEVNQITKQFDVSGADVVKRLDIINNKLKDNDLQGINLNSGAANMLIRQESKVSPTGYEAYNRIVSGESEYGTGKIARELQNRFGSPEFAGTTIKGQTSGGIEAVAPSFITGGEAIKPGGNLVNQGFGKQYEVPERLGGMPKSTDTVTAPTTTPTVDTTTAPTTAPTVDTTSDLTPPANISSILTPIGETETGPATDLSIRGAFSAGGVGNIRLGKQKGKGRKGMAKTRTSAGRSIPKMTNIGIR